MIEWDVAGERRYETGIDRGVLYLPGGGAIPWNGLTSVTEERGREKREFYLDGYKYLEQFPPGEYSARLQAYTYPDELEELLGLGESAPGVFLHDQPLGAFNLSYRTGISNEISADLGYKIHIVYNVRAVPASTAFNTQSSGFNASMFEWTLSAISAILSGASPTNHISINSRKIDPEKLEAIENAIYNEAAPLPTLSEIVAMAA